MKDTMVMVAVAALCFAQAAVQADELIPITHTSQSTRDATVTHGTVQMTSHGGTIVALTALDADDNLITVDATHQLSPSNGFDLWSGPLFVGLDEPGPMAEGIDAPSNITGQSGGLGVTTMLSEMDATFDPARPQSAQVQAGTLSSQNQFTTDVNREILHGIRWPWRKNTVSVCITSDNDHDVNEKVDKNERMPMRGRKCPAHIGVVVDHHHITFHAETDATIHLTESMSLAMTLDIADDPPADVLAFNGLEVSWAFGTGSVIGENVLLSDLVFFEITADADHPINNFSLTDQAVYDLTRQLTAGQSYWFSVDTLAYSMTMVPEPSSVLLLLIPASAALARRGGPRALHHAPTGPPVSMRLNSQ